MSCLRNNKRRSWGSNPGPLAPESDSIPLNHRAPITEVRLRIQQKLKRGGVAQWIGRRISDQGVPGSIPRRCTFRCGLEQVTFTLCLVLVKPRKRWTDDQLGQTVTRLEITLCLMC